MKNVIFLENHKLITQAVFGSHAWCVKAKITGEKHKQRLMESSSVVTEELEPSVDETSQDYYLVDFPNHS